jgi:hypothetical protein
MPDLRDRGEGVAGAVGPDQPTTGFHRLARPEAEGRDEPGRVLPPTGQRGEVLPGEGHGLSDAVVAAVRARDVSERILGVAVDPRKLTQERGV